MVALGLAVLVCDVVASRVRIAPPVVLLVCGALLGFVPEEPRLTSQLIPCLAA